jgi:hypothetical protein
MTVRELALMAGDYPWHVVSIFVTLPLLSLVVGLFHGQGEGGRGPWRYVYTLLVYAACVPGMFAAVLTAYTLFFTRENLLDVNLLVYLLPIVSMTATLMLIRKNATFDEIPGFDRLSGLMVLIAITFVFVLAIERTRIWLLFGGSMVSLVALVVGLYALLKWGAYMVFRKKDEPRVKPPSLKFP